PARGGRGGSCRKARGFVAATPGGGGGRHLVPAGWGRRKSPGGQAHCGKLVWPGYFQAGRRPRSQCRPGFRRPGKNATIRRYPGDGNGEKLLIVSLAFHGSGRPVKIDGLSTNAC